MTLAVLNKVELIGWISLALLLPLLYSMYRFTQSRFSQSGINSNQVLRFYSVEPSIIHTNSSIGNKYSLKQEYDFVIVFNGKNIPFIKLGLKLGIIDVSYFYDRLNRIKNLHEDSLLLIRIQRNSELLKSLKEQLAHIRLFLLDLSKWHVNRYAINLPSRVAQFKPKSLAL